MGMPSDADVIALSIESPSAFGELFDRHATSMFRYFVRRVGPDHADTLLGDLFRIAFERRATFDTARIEARPWLYGIANNLLAQHKRREARRLKATARLVRTTRNPTDLFDEIDARIDAAALWPRVATAIAELPEGERDALLLFAWEGLPYEQVASALDIPLGTVRSRLNRARTRIRELVGGRGEQRVTNTLRPDRVLPVDEGDPGIFKREKEYLMSMIEDTTPDQLPRATYPGDVPAALLPRRSRCARVPDPGLPVRRAPGGADGWWI